MSNKFIPHRRPGPVFLFIAFIAGLIGYGHARLEAQDAAARPPAATVEIVGVEYKPARVSIRVGDSVEWKNSSWFTHTVTCEPSLANNKNDVQLPEGAAPFHSGDLRKNESFRHTFTVPGTYRYFCIPHEEKGMVGEVIVEQ